METPGAHASSVPLLRADRHARCVRSRGVHLRPFSAIATVVICPKCGFQQEGGSECRRCGIVFERYHAPKESLPSWVASAPPEEESSTGAFKKFFRIFRWFTLAAGVLIVVLILHQGEPPTVETDPRAKESVQTKLYELQRARQSGDSYDLRLKESEINSWVGSSLALAPPAGPQTSSQIPAAAQNPGRSEPTLEEVQSSMRDVKVNLLDDRLRAYVLFNFHGKDLSLSLEGRLRVENGYLRLEPTSGSLGSLPLPQAVLDRAVQRIFDSPENKEKFKVPPEVRDIRVVNRELVVFYR